MRRSIAGLAIVFGPFVVLAILYRLTTSPLDTGRPAEIADRGPLTIALAGDVLLTGALGRIERDQAFIAARSAVASADFAIANLEMNLLDGDDAAQADARPEPRWPYGSARDAVTLKQFGFDLLTLANDHATDYGPGAPAATRRVLEGAGLRHAGAGPDLAGARAPAIAGRIAVVAATASPTFTVDEADRRGVLDAVRLAHGSAEIVIVSLHAHEPSESGDSPAPFIVRFARAAIDEGASIAVVNGPHRVRGVERYKAGAILYGLGHFMYRAERFDFRAANPFDAPGAPRPIAAGGSGSAQAADDSPFDNPAWWESMLAVATVDEGRVAALRLIPIDLGADKSMQTKGMPRVARAEQARRVLGAASSLSRAFGTSVHADSGLVEGPALDPHRQPN